MRHLICMLALFLSFSAIGQTKLIEKVEKKGDEITIPYEKYMLPNGLTLIVHEDHSDPLVHVDVTYHVGSAREELNKSGFAHFFEHMMFQGSENVADEQHFKIVTESGGTLNGTTNRDRTNYFETVPANQLETMLWLEADRMGFFLDAVTQEKFEVQRATVKNEKGQNYDNRPYGYFQELSAGVLYPYGHPYSWLTIGRLEDLDRVNVEDLKKFFMRWYGPNNAVLTVGGDVNPKDVVKLVEKYFGTRPRGPEVKKMKLETPALEANRYASYVDKNIRFPALVMTYPTVPRFHPDEAPLDCLAEILGSGKNSYFYKKFVETGKAISASTNNPASELAGELTMFVLPFPGNTLSDFETEIASILAEFEKDGVAEEDVEKFKAGMESNMINGLASVSGKVSQLASYETMYGNPNALGYDIKRYANVTKEDVMRVFKKYIKDKPAVVLSVLPNADTQPAKPDTYAIPMEGENTYPVTDYSKLTYKRATGDKFDRKQRPGLGENPLAKVPEFWKEEFKNGVKIIGTKSDEIPTVSIQLTINGGHLMDANDMSKAGLSSLTAAMMNEATKNFSSADIERELEKLGSNVSISSGSTSTVMNISTLKKNLDRTLELAEEMLLRPAFKEEDFDRLKKQQLEGIQASEKDPASIASVVFDKLIYGENNIMAVPESGTSETVEKITLDDVKAFYANYLTPSLSELVIVGDVDQKEIMPKLDFLREWTGKKAMLPEMPERKDVEKTIIYFVDKTDAPQSQIRVGAPSDLTYDATGEYFRSYLMNFPLGAAFNSRINLNLREDKGWTYGARSYFTGNEYPGAYMVSTGVKASASDSSLVEIMKELKDYQENGITDDELSFMRKAIGQSDARRYETPWQKASFLQRILHYNLDRSYVDEQAKIIDSITKEEINALAMKHLDYKKMKILMVGDEATILPKLKELGYEVILLDEKGEKKVVKP